MNQPQWKSTNVQPNNIAPVSSKKTKQEQLKSYDNRKKLTQVLKDDSA